MFVKYILILCSLLTSFAESASYDQRQTGDLNVQVDLKDIHIIALMKGGKEEYVDYDYAYDYSEMTIKPQNSSTTAKPLNVTTDTENHNATVATTFFEQATEPIKNESWSSVQSPDPSPSQPVVASTTTEKSATEVVSELPTPTIPGNDNTTVAPTSSNSTDCKKGFVLNHKGDCELKLQSTGNALLKLVKLSQRLKLKRANRRNRSGST